MKLGSFLIISLMLSSNALIMSSFTEGEPSPPLVRGPLDAIKIDSDAELIDMASDLNWTGSGTEGDPIVISNLTIDTSGGYYGMLIANTTLHIVIENCSFYNSTDGFPHPFPSSGLILFNVISVVVTNSTFSYNTNGMTIGGCMNVEVRNSSFLRNLRGIEMILSNNSRILGCTMEENTRDGIFIETSEMCIVQGNMVLRNDPGIMLYRSEYNRISGNTMLYTSDEGVLLEYSNYNIVNDNFIDGFGDGDGITLSKASRDNIILNNTLKDPQEYGILLIKAANNKFYSNDLINCSFAIDDLYSIRESSSYYTSEVPANNTVNGKPLIYLMDLDLIGSTISPDCGQLFLVNVSNGLVEDVHLNNATFGIWLFQSSNIEIRNCSVMNMIYHGLQIFDSNNIRIRKVSFRECYYALFVMGSDRVTCSNSSFYYCDTGTFFRESVNCDLIGNEIHNMANYGVECVSSKFSIIDNIITLCERGIEMYDSILDECENAVRGNTISNCTEGIRGIAWFASVSNNNIMGCDLGIRMGAIRSVNSSIHHNHIESSHGDGVLLDGFSIRVHNNSIYAENGYGIHLAGPGYNVIENNRMYNCSITFSDFRRDVSRNTIGPGNMVNDLPVLMLLDPYGIYEDFNEPILAGQVLIQANYVELSNVHVSNATVGFYIDANTAFIDSCSVSRCDVGMEVGDDPTIENCRIFENDIGMKVVEWSPGASITDCEFVNNSIAVFNDGGERLALYSNLFLVNDKGVATYNGGDCTIKWNRFHNGPGPALSLTSGRDIVRDNMFIDNNDQIEGLDQISATEGTIVSDNYWS
ncbi:MAG: right-handed parallel beta-helix repeat-containing protein, partial [Thermoplasmata archaeon]|nr:right-handed parallel beta-helix repeat-containing protein [Thermoplasmata archaeon]